MKPKKKSSKSPTSPLPLKSPSSRPHRETHCPSGLTGWWSRLRDTYKDSEEFEAYDEIYGLAARLGFGSAQDAWDDNPWVRGSVEPSDFGLMEFPRFYLHVRDCKTGQEWIRPLRGSSLMHLETQVRKWAKETFGGELYLDGKIIRKHEGDYYGQLITDSRGPDGIAWDAGGFWLTAESNALLRGSLWTP